MSLDQDLSVGPHETMQKASISQAENDDTSGS